MNVVSIEELQPVYCVSALYKKDFFNLIENVSKSKAEKICKEYISNNRNNPLFVDCFVGRKIL